MTPRAQQAVIAEVCGWTCVNGMWHNPDGTPIGFTPDYPADLNAMHEAEKVLTPQQSEIYVSILDDVLEIPSTFYGTARRAYLVAHATAARRAEAFLRTIGKWDDAK